MLRAISDSYRIHVSRPYSCSRDYLLIHPLHRLGHLAQSGKLEMPLSFYIIVSWFSLDSPSAAQQLKRSSNRALNCGSQLPIENCHRLSQPAQSGSFNRAAPVILHNSLWAESRQLYCSCKLKHLSSFELQSTSSIARMEVHYSSIHEGLQLNSGPFEKAVLYIILQSSWLGCMVAPPNRSLGERCINYLTDLIGKSRSLHVCGCVNMHRQ